MEYDSIKWFYISILFGLFFILMLLTNPKISNFIFTNINQMDFSIISNSKI